MSSDLLFTWSARLLNLTLPRCVDCSQVFTSQGELKLHVSVKHGGMLQCDQCDEVLQDEPNLEAHNRVHHPESGARKGRGSHKYR